ncbi:MAG: NAD-dependent epimerase/dehydratase family protein [Chthoniobacterales bacterium]|nr:NAD-dependent epimerase/dehydratase family protein [Chthoniobacterales bacterium]
MKLRSPVRPRDQSAVEHLLIAGCGYVGEAAADLFHAAGWSVEGWTASEKSASLLAGKPYRVRAVNVSQRGEVAARASAGVGFDAIILCASTRGGDAHAYRRVYLQGAQNLLETFPGSKLFFTSSTSVYAQRDASWVTEQSETQPTHERARILLETERLVIGSGGTVLRVAGIHGPGRSALLSRFLQGAAVIDPQIDRFVNQVHRDDIAAALLLLLSSDLGSGQIYNVVDDQPILQSECYRWLAERLRRPLPPIKESAQTRKRGDSNKRVSNAKLRGLGWEPRYPTFAEAMDRSILPSFADRLS